MPVQFPYVNPHNKKAREVQPEDLERAMKVAPMMHALCGVPHGGKNGAYAVAHPQIDDQDPLQFWVTKKGHVLINAHVVDHTLYNNHLHAEGCMSYPDMPDVMVQRFYRGVVEAQSIGPDKIMTAPFRVELKGLEFYIVQHEIDHFNGISIYDRAKGGEQK